MLVIRNVQMAAFARPARERFIRKSIRDVAELFPEHPVCRDEAALREWIEHGIAAAARYGIQGEREVSLFLFLIFEFGRDFDRQPEREWMRALLNAGNLDGAAKLDLIYERLRILTPEVTEP